MANNTLLASDNFASGSLASGWAANSFGVLAAVGGSLGAYYAEPPNTTTAGAQIWTALSWPNDQISEVTIKALPSNTSNLISVMARWQSTTVISGYVLEINSINVKLLKYVAGTPTTLLSPANTPAIGDVWTLTAAGTCLLIYVNNKLVNWIYDATFTSGTPGFWVSDTVPSTHSHISAWRGYSFQQNDGIWTKQQIIMPYSPTLDGAGSPSGEFGPQNPTIIYEGNSQLGLTGNVYKMWFTSIGYPNATGQIGYAESYDMYNWTRKASNVLSASGMGITPFVTKVGSTYYCFDGYGTVQLWSSSNGISWSQVSANVFSVSELIYFAPVIQVAGTWYAYYTVQINAYPPQIFYATASAITGPWTAGNSGAAIYSGAYGIQQVFQVGSTYYTWCQSVNSSKQSSKPGIDPGEGMRLQSTNLTTWTNPTNSIHHTHMAEYVNGVNASSVPGWMLNLNNKATMVYQLNQDDAIATANSIFQLGIAQASAPIATIVTAPENALAQKSIDSFARSAGGLGANWTIPTGQTGLQIASSGVIEPNAASAYCMEYYSAASFGAAQYSTVTLLALSGTQGSGSFVSPTVYQQASGFNCYVAAVIADTGTLATTVIQKVVSGTATSLGPTVPFTPNIGDTLTLAVWQGSDGFNVISFYQNGFLVSQVQDYGNTYLSGNPGIVMQGASEANAQISGWSGGNANAIPSYGGSGSSGFGFGGNFGFRF